MIVRCRRGRMTSRSRSASTTMRLIVSGLRMTHFWRKPLASTLAARASTSMGIVAASQRNLTRTSLVWMAFLLRPRTWATSSDVMPSVPDGALSNWAGLAFKRAINFFGEPRIFIPCFVRFRSSRLSRARAFHTRVAFSPFTKRDFRLRGATCARKQRVQRRINIAVLTGSTLRTRPLPYCKPAKAGRSRQAPARRTGLGGKPGINLDIPRTACTALVRQHGPKLGLRAGRHALPKQLGNRLMAIRREYDQFIFAHQFATELVVAVAALVGDTLLNPRRRSFVTAALSARQPRRRRLPLARVLEFHTIARRQQ